MEEIILETKELCKQYHKQTVLKKYQYENSEKGVYTGFGSKWRRKIDIDENIVRDDAGRCRGSIFLTEKYGVESA